jgi:hypothetical protein
MQTTLPKSTFASLLAVSLGALASSAAAQDAPQEDRAERPTVEQVVSQVKQYCGACHAVPSPDILPKRHWPVVIETMAEIAQRRLGRANISRNQLRDITAFYYGSAPETLPVLPHTPDAPAGAFVMKEIGKPAALPYITNVNASPLKKTRDVELIVSDGASKRVSVLRRQGKTWNETSLADADIPVHTQVVDFDGDKDFDVLVAELGAFPPLDVKVGKVSLLRQVAPGKFVRELLQDGLGRVSDARALDLDADGDLDVAIAVFGGGDAGELFWLENVGRSESGPYRRRELLKLSGAIGIEPADLDGDGKTDLVALIAQEHEMIVAFANRGGGEFEQRVIARAPHPMYGSTSLSTVDLDRDGDVDIVFTNGDAFDAQTDPKPYHGVQWLENRGGFDFTFHDIGRFYGAATAVAGDLDRDGDIDVVAGSWVNFWDDPHRHALVWFENDGRQNFSAHGVATRPAGIVSLQLVDVNGDGAPDIVAGALRMDLLLAKLGSEYKAGRLFPPAPPSGLYPRVLVFENHIK